MLTSEHLRPGYLLRDFALADGRMLSDARGARTLLLLLGNELGALRKELEDRRAEIAAEQAFLLDAGDDAAIRRALEPQNGGPVATPLVLITDRYGEIVHVWERTTPDAEAVLRMLQYVTIRCEECFPPEWPAL